MGASCLRRPESGPVRPGGSGVGPPVPTPQGRPGAPLLRIPASPAYRDPEGRARLPPQHAEHGGLRGRRQEVQLQQLGPRLREGQHGRHARGRQRLAQAAGQRGGGRGQGARRPPAPGSGCAAAATPGRPGPGRRGRGARAAGARGRRAPRRTEPPRRARTPHGCGWPPAGPGPSASARQSHSVRTNSIPKLPAPRRGGTAGAGAGAREAGSLRGPAALRPAPRGWRLPPGAPGRPAPSPLPAPPGPSRCQPRTRQERDPLPRAGN